ncbi:uncharacterized protein HKW66_Vig0179800 [Vigna angularis]|uniref:Uncharacterized protein n=1 Tax=Phaseolus angularis TaxID=3914 RepID=A0A8T0JYV4_PHAAN|nr:uncharacterized protein HKW66_Vig0179800 [Vigna angularis]
MEFWMGKSARSLAGHVRSTRCASSLVSGKERCIQKSNLIAATLFHLLGEKDGLLGEQPSFLKKPESL